MANLENYSEGNTENFQKDQSERSDSQMWSPNSGTLAEIRAKWDVESQQSGQEADDLLYSIENPQQPEGEVVLLSSLDPEFVEERKNAKLDDLIRWLSDLLGRGNLEESTKQEIAERTAKLFGPKWTIVYNGKAFFANQLYDKIKDGTFNVDWRNLDSLFSNARIILDRYVNKLEIATPEGMKYEYQITFGTIIINDKQ